MKIIEKIPMMSTSDTVTLWRNALRALEVGNDCERASLVVEAVGEEWRRRAIPFDTGEWFSWPTTVAPGGDRSLDTNHWMQEGMLKYLGYSVGNQTRESSRTRHRMLGEV